MEKKYADLRQSFYDKLMDFNVSELQWRRRELEFFLYETKGGHERRILYITYRN